MTSLSPEQNFEVIDPLSVEVVDHPLGFADSSNHHHSHNHQLNGLGSPNSLDGFQSVSAPSSLDPTASFQQSTAADLGQSIVIIPSPQLPKTLQQQQQQTVTVGQSIRLFDLDDLLLPPLPSSSDEPMTSSFGLVTTATTNNNNHSNNRSDPIHRPNSDWEIMGQSIIAETRRQQVTSSNESSITDKLKLFWTNARYQIKATTTTGLSETQPICLLGVRYLPRQASSDDLFDLFRRPSNRNRHQQQNPAAATTRSHYDRFKLDFWSRIWITYRKDFSPLAKTSCTSNSSSSSGDDQQLSSDLGWGCMIRSGQMMLAQAFIAHRLNRDWLYCPSSSSYGDYATGMATHRQIIRWFADSANRTTSPFSIHQLTELSQECLSKRPGDWFGPSSIAVVLRKALVEAGQTTPEIARIGMYVAVDCTVFLKDVEELARKHEAVIIFVPVRLGMDSFDLSFEDTLKAFLNCKYTLGIIGGKPKHSLYFVGFQGSSLIYLDPHFCQPTVDTDTDPQLFDVRSYHCDTPQKTSFSNIDPSLALGFLFKSPELHDFKEKMSSILRANKKVFVMSPSSFEDHQQQCNQLDDAGVDQMGFHNLSLPPAAPGHGSRRHHPPSSSIASEWFVPSIRHRTEHHEHVRKSPRDDEGFIKIPKPPNSGGSGGRY